MAVEAAEAVDFNELPDEVIDQIVSSGGVMPETQDPAEQAVVTDEPVVETEKEESKEDAEAEPEVTEEVVEPEIAFTFTENADETTYLAERRSYLDQVELPEELQLIIERDAALIAERDQRIQEISAQAGNSEDSTVFNALVQFVQDETGNWVPNTAPFADYVETKFEAEKIPLLVELLSRPSKKYNGWSVQEELIRDHIGLDETGMEQLQMLFKNGGRLPIPSYLPPGIDQAVLDAYWYSPNREALTQQLDRANFVLNDSSATPSEIAEARAEITQINTTLAREQRYIDHEKQIKAQQQQQQQDLRSVVQQEGLNDYMQTAKTLTAQLRNQITPLLTSLEGTGQKVMGAAISNLIVNALADQDEIADDSRKTLEEWNIKVDWKQAQDVLNRLLVSKTKQRALKHTRANERAIVLEQANERSILLELNPLTKTLEGQILAAVASGTSNALKSKIAAVKKVSVRPKVEGGAQKVTTEDGFEKMTLEEINEYIKTNGR
jgi:hypothetical protein